MAADFQVLPRAAGTPSQMPPLSEVSHSPQTVVETGHFLDAVIDQAHFHQLGLQKEAGFWVYPLEADTTIPSEYVFLQRFLGRPLSATRRRQLAAYIRKRQLPDGGWPLFTGGEADISATVKAYFALKLLGESPESSSMKRARLKILNMGGAARVNVFTRLTLALFGQIPWRTTPAMPIEIMLLPRWFFFHLSKISYWSRTVIVPLLLLYAHRPVCRLEPEEGLRELFCKPPEDLLHLDSFGGKSLRQKGFILLDRILKKFDPLFPGRSRKRAIRKAEEWTRSRMQGEGGLGAIFPAMVNAVMALRVLGAPEDDPDYLRGVKAIDELILEGEEEILCQPCHSPIWDCALSLSALLESDVPPRSAELKRAVNWLFDQQIFLRGDWSEKAPDLKPGGWAFQFENALYPDVDDTPMVLMALLRAGAHENPEGRKRIVQAVNWVLGMQNSDGGWGAFDIDNDYLYLNDIPFADHGALLDPSTSDLTARCIELLAMLGYDRNFPPIARALEFLRREQEDCGAWFGRWGVNYIYGTWSVLCGLGRLGEDMSSPWVQKAVGWLQSRQNPDGGWGESCLSYADPALAGKGETTPSQTAWALLGLMAAGEHDHPSVHRGIDYLLASQGSGGKWEEAQFTGTGFPRVFYLRYHGYSQFFPLWALGVYRRLQEGRPSRQQEVTLFEPLEGLRQGGMR